jgi:hypothetical protein
VQVTHPPPSRSPTLHLNQRQKTLPDGRDVAYAPVAYTTYFTPPSLSSCANFRPGRHRHARCNNPAIPRVGRKNGSHLAAHGVVPPLCREYSHPLRIVHEMTWVVWGPGPRIGYIPKEGAVWGPGPRIGYIPKEGAVWGPGPRIGYIPKEGIRV